MDISEKGNLFEKEQSRTQNNRLKRGINRWIKGCNQRRDRIKFYLERVLRREKRPRNLI